MARTKSTAPHAPISPKAETAYTAHRHGDRQRQPLASLPSTLSAFKQRLRYDRRLTSHLAANPRRLRSIASNLLQTDPQALEMYADENTLTAYLRAIIDSLMRPTWLT